MFCPIVTHKLCKKGKELYDAIFNVSKNNSPLLKKIEIYDDDYQLLLKTIPMHQQNNYSETIPINGKLIVRRK